MSLSIQSMATTYGVSLVLAEMPTGATHVRNTIPGVLHMYQTEVSNGVKVALAMVLIGVMIVMSTMQKDAIDVKMIPIVTAIVLSMTIRTAQMLSSIVPTRMSDCSSVLR
jgi:hypothetical protein